MAKEAVQLGVFDVIDKQDLSPALLEQSIKCSQRHKQTELFLDGDTTVKNEQCN
ncbi:hypothetical protein [Alkalimarinus alittae]|uniref:Uncharacterized protein n=1 Tax=Alkalimarinus alittae TaxID=2961619 RepID=A0ABY6MXK7_9ALTE|nr:hypothetical protein [Alkalimarinus alittae]UZE94540.1 hypothetical protein NKI27_10620 [Alkalimarinus alittae]